MPITPANAIDRSALLPAALRDDFPILSEEVGDDQPLAFLDLSLIHI